MTITTPAGKDILLTKEQLLLHCMYVRTYVYVTVFAKSVSSSSNGPPMPYFHRTCGFQ